MATASITVDLWDPIYTALESMALDIIAHSNSCAPQEAVALLCTDGMVFPLINRARSAERFAISESQITEAVVLIEARGQVPFALYHSHPTQPAIPSTADCESMRLAPYAISVIHGKKTIPGADGPMTVDHFSAYYAESDDPHKPVVKVGDFLFQAPDYLV